MPSSVTAADMFDSTSTLNISGNACDKRRGTWEPTNYWLDEAWVLILNDFSIKYAFVDLPCSSKVEAIPPCPPIISPVPPQLPSRDLRVQR